jgi:hypothetical protein
MKHTSYEENGRESMPTTVVMTKEEKDRIFEEAMIAEEAGDSQKARALLKKIPISAKLAMGLKNAVGSEIMRSVNLNYADAEAKYGPNWLQS